MRCTPGLVKNILMCLPIVPTEWIVAIPEMISLKEESSQRQKKFMIERNYHFVSAARVRRTFMTNFSKQIAFN